MFQNIQINSDAPKTCLRIYKNDQNFHPWIFFGYMRNPPGQIGLRKGTTMLGGSPQRD